MFDDVRKQSILYKRGVKGEVRVWCMDLGIYTNDLAGHRVWSGIEGGVMTPSGWTVAEPTNVDKSNARDSREQAEAEILAEYAKRRRIGYFDNPFDIDKVTFTKPMLAQDWEKRKAKVSLDLGVYAQPKLDGIRCIARADGLWTRTGKRITALPHIADSLAGLFEQQPDLILDGELYNHDLKDDFNTITSIVRKVAPTPDEIALAESQILYCVYDMPSDPDVFSRRSLRLKSLLETRYLVGYLRYVETHYATTQDELDALYVGWMESGFEGQMIRLDAPYENKRSNTLMKRKDFVSEEFKVLAMEEGKGNWAGCVKRFIVELPDGTTNEATPRGTQVVLGALLRSGKTPEWATVRYFGETPDGKLRFPVATDWGFGTRTD